MLKEIGLDFDVTSVNVEETFPDDLSPEEVAVYLAELKANAFDFSAVKPSTLLITADTIVVLNRKILGKPVNREGAFRIIYSLSGKVHEVITAVTLRTQQVSKSFFVKTDVHFKSLRDEEIYFYIDQYKPYDKAGAYGIQEWIGFIGIDHIEGSFYNIMGLPTQKLYEELCRL